MKAEPVKPPQTTMGETSPIVDPALTDPQGTIRLLRIRIQELEAQLFTGNGFNRRPTPLSPAYLKIRREREKRARAVIEGPALKRAKNLEALRRRLEAHFLRWIRERCYTEDLVETPVRALLADYRGWAKRVNERVECEHHWGLFMRSRFIYRMRGTAKTKQKVRVVMGIGLKEPPPGV